VFPSTARHAPPRCGRFMILSYEVPRRGVLHLTIQRLQRQSPRPNRVVRGVNYGYCCSHSTFAADAEACGGGDGWELAARTKSRRLLRPAGARESERLNVGIMKSRLRRHDPVPALYCKPHRVCRSSTWS
jgi:hypothetical protein